MAGFTDPEEYISGIAEQFEDFEEDDPVPSDRAGFTDPQDFVLRLTESEGYRPRGASYDFEFDNVGRVEWPPDRPSADDDEKWEPLTGGDPDFPEEDYLPSAQTPSAHAERELHDAARQAQRALDLDPNAEIYTPEERQALENIANTGQKEQGGGFFGGLLNVLDVIDRPGELVRAGIYDIFGDSDDPSGEGEVQLGDYWNMLTGNDEAVRERLGDDVVGEAGQFLFEGSHLLEQVGMEEGWQRTALGIGIDIAADPLTYATFGTAGVGRKAAIEATTAATTGSWRQAAKAVGRGTVDDLGDPIEKRAARIIENRIQRDSDEAVEALRARKKELTPEGQQVADVTPREEQIIRETTRRQVLAREDRLASVLEGKELSEIDAFTEDIMKLGDDVEFGTELEKEIGHLARLQSEKRYKDLEELFPEYIESDIMPSFAKGGLRLAASPFGRKNQNMISLGLRRNAKLPRLFDSALDKMPDGTSRWLRERASKFSQTRQLLNRAKDYDPYSNDLSRYVAVKASQQAFDVTDLGIRLHSVAPEARHEFNELLRVGRENGIEDDDMLNIVRRYMGARETPDTLADLPTEAQSQIIQSAESIRGAFETIHAAAEEVGINPGYIEDFVPLVADSTYSKIVRGLVESGGAVRLDTAADAEERLGRELISAFVGSEGSRKPTAVRRLGESTHTSSRINTAAYQSSLGGTDVTRLNIEDLRPLLNDAGVGYYDHETLNRSIMKALNSLVDEGKVDPRLVDKLDDAPFETNLVNIMDSYMNSMSEAIRVTDQANRLRQSGLLMDRVEKISVTRTLDGVADATKSQRHPIMQFMDDLATAIEEGGDASVARRAAETETVTVRKGWDMEVPAAITGTKEFDRIMRGLRRAYDKTMNNVRDARGAVEAHTYELVHRGVPRELAEQIALVDSNAELFTLMDEMRGLADTQAAQVRRLAAEQVALNAHKMTDEAANGSLHRAAQEAAELRRGVEDTISDMEQQLADNLNVPYRSEAGRVHDLTQAPSPRQGDNRNFLQWVADEADARIAALGATDEAAEAAAEREAVEGAVSVLKDSAQVVDLTVADVVEYRGARKAAVTLAPLYDKLEEVGGRQAAEELMPADLRQAVSELYEAQDELMNVRMGNSIVTVEDAQAGLRQAEEKIDELAEEFGSSDVLLADTIEGVRDTVLSVVDDPLFSDSFNDVWAASFRKMRNMDKGEFAEAMREQGVKSVGQTELFQQNTKQMNDFAGARARLGLHEAALADAAQGTTSEYVAPRIDKAIQALRAGDTNALPSYQDEIRQIVHNAWPSLDASRIYVRPSGAVVLAEEVAEEGWTTLDDVLPELRRVIPEGENMNVDDLVGTAFEAWRDSPEAMEGVTDELANWFRQLDGEGGYDYDLESFEYLRDFAARLRATETSLEGSAARAAQRVPQSAVSTMTASTKLDEVLDAVDGLVHGRKGMGAKKLRNVFERNVATLKKGLPANIVDQLRHLVDFSIGLREAKLPKTILDKQTALRSRMWEPLEDTTTRAFDDIEDLAAEAARRNSDTLANASDKMRYFLGRLAHLESFGEGADVARGGVRRGAEGLVDETGEFASAFDEARDALAEAVEASKRVADEDRTLLDDLIPPKGGKPRSLNKWVKEMEDQMERWEPKTVPVADKEGFVDLSSHKIAGEAFGDAIADRHVAMVLDNMAGRVAQIGSAEGMKAFSRKARGVIRWWRAAATVARPTFVPRNMIGGIFNGEIIGVPLKAYRMAAQDVMPAIRRVRTGKATWDEVIADARPQAQSYLEGIRDSDVLETSFAVSSLEHLRKGVTMGERLNPASQYNALFYGGSKVMEASEDFLRSAAFIAHYDPERVATMGSARAVAMAAHFDYKNLTPAEENIKILAPFFTWTKNNIPLQIRTIFERPGVYTRYNHAVQNVKAEQPETKADDFADSRFRSDLAVPLGWMLGGDDGWWSRAVFDPDLPFRDVEEMMGSWEDGVPGVAEWAAGLVAPQFSAPLDLVNATYQTNAPTGLAEIIKFTDPIVPGEPTVAVDGSVRVPGWAANLFRTALPFSQELAEVGGVTPNTGTQAARLGVETGDGVDAGERIRQSALRLARAGGLQFQVPGDSESAAFLAEDQVFDIQDTARMEGRLVDPEQREALIDAILERHGLN